MSRQPIEAYRLSPAAQADLDRIWDHTARTWSPDQADRYLRGLGEKLLLLCSNPEIARERPEIDPPVRLHPFRAHLIVYRIADDHLAILRVVHKRQHWQALLNEQSLLRPWETLRHWPQPQPETPRSRSGAGAFRRRRSGPGGACIRRAS